MIFLSEDMKFSCYGIPEEVARKALMGVKIMMILSSFHLCPDSPSPLGFHLSPLRTVLLLSP